MEGQNDGNIVTRESAVEAQQQVMENRTEFTEQDKLDYAKYMSDPENISKATHMAYELTEIVGKNWFSLRRLMHKAKLPKETAFMKLSLLMQFGMLVHKEEKMKVNKSWERVTVYKVAVSNESKIAELRLAIEYYKSEISKLEGQIATLSEKSPAQN